jgi:hypothetical protein
MPSKSSLAMVQNRDWPDSTTISSLRHNLRLLPLAVYKINGKHVVGKHLTELNVAVRVDSSFEPGKGRVLP